MIWVLIVYHLKVKFAILFGFAFVKVVILLGFHWSFFFLYITSELLDMKACCITNWIMTVVILYWKWLFDFSGYNWIFYNIYKKKCCCQFSSRGILDVWEEDHGEFSFSFSSFFASWGFIRLWNMSSLFGA